MLVEKKLEGDKLTVKINEAINTTTAPLLASEINLESVNELLFDLSGVNYVSSAGLRVFLNCQKILTGRGGRMLITGANEAVMNIFKITGFVKIIKFV